VEDEPAILRLVTIVLEEMGCQTLAVPDAETALEVLAHHIPDLVLADVRLPGMDGIELARRLKRDPSLARTPVLLMSAYGEPADHDGDGFLPKPFDLEELAYFLARYMGR
jgi:CheY-like chemotaxis protein